MKRRNYEMEWEENLKEDPEDPPYDEEGFEYTYNYHYVTPDKEESDLNIPEKTSVREVVKREAPKKLLVMIQLLVCTTILLLAVFIKLLGGPVYETAKNWYWEHLNNSIIAQEKMDLLKEACLRFMTPPEQSEESAASQEVSYQEEEHSVLFTTSSDSDAPVSLSILLSRPVENGVITSAFGLRENEIHDGVDIGAEEGSGIYPALPGVVVECGEGGSYGNYIVIDHGNQIQTRYAHCSALFVKKGDWVSYGRKIAAIGHTGDADGSHLHLELILNGICYNPQPLFREIKI